MSMDLLFILSRVVVIPRITTNFSSIRNLEICKKAHNTATDNTILTASASSIFVSQKKFTGNFHVTCKFKLFDINLFLYYLHISIIRKRYRHAQTDSELVFCFKEQFLHGRLSQALIANSLEI